MNLQANNLYEFGSFRFDPEHRVLMRDGKPVPLPPKIGETLLLLVQNAGNLVEKEELIKSVWPDAFVEEGNLNKNIFVLRKTLGQFDGGLEYIETIPKRGYRFAAPVVQIEEAPSWPQSKESDGTHASKQRGLWYWVFGASTLLTAAILLLTLMWSAADGLKVASFRQLTNDGRDKNGPLGTEGSRVYMTESQTGPGSLLTQVSVRGGETVPLSISLKEPREVDLSKDGTELLLLEGESEEPPSLWIQSVVGGAAHRVGNVVADCAAWGPTGQTILYSKGHDIYIAGRDGGSSRKLISVPGQPSDFRFSPDGTRLRFTLADDQDHTTSLWETSSDGAQLHPVLSGWNTPASECCGNWAANGEYFFFQSTQNGRTDIWAIREKRRLLGALTLEPQRLTSGPIEFYDPVSSTDSRELFGLGVLRRAEVLRYDLSGHRFVPYLSGISAEGLDFSRDGNWVTYTSYPDGLLWRSRSDGNERLQLTFPPMRVFLPRWSPDGKQIAFMGSPPSGPWKLGGPWKLYLVSSNGGTPRQILQDKQEESDPTWSPDGRSIVFGRPWHQNLPADSMRMCIEIVDLTTLKVSTVPDSCGLFSPRISADGRYIIAFRIPHPVRPQLFDFVSRKWTQVAETEMGYPSWSQDSKYIYLQDWNHGDPRIVRLLVSARRFESLMAFSEVGRNMAGTIVQWTGVAPDGSPLLAGDISSKEVYALNLQNR